MALTWKNVYIYIHYICYNIYIHKDDIYTIYIKTYHIHVMHTGMYWCAKLVC